MAGRAHCRSGSVRSQNGPTTRALAASHSDAGIWRPAAPVACCAFGVLYSGCLGTAHGVRGGLPSLSGLPVRSAAVPSRQAQSTASEASQVEHGGLGSRRPLWLGHIQPPSPKHLPSFAPPAVLQGVPLVAREPREVHVHGFGEAPAAPEGSLRVRGS